MVSLLMTRERISPGECFLLSTVPASFPSLTSTFVQTLHSRLDARYRWRDFVLDQEVRREFEGLLPSW